MTPLRGSRKPARSPLGHWIDEHTARQGLTMKQLAERAAVSRPRISQLRMGDKARREMVRKLARALTPPGADEVAARALLREGLLAAGLRPGEADPDLNLRVSFAPILDALHAVSADLEPEDVAEIVQVIWAKARERVAPPGEI